MNEALKQFSEQLALELKGKLSSEQTAEFVKTVKASGDDRTFEVVMSTSDEDRQGDALDQSKWDFKYFLMNPVVLWAHNYSSFPIGIVEDIRVEGDSAVATGKFAPVGINPEADMACALYQEKILRTVSPGYIQNEDGTRELLEMSFCPVPAGRYALSMRQVGRLGVSTRDLVSKGFFFEEKTAKAEAVGDACQLEDGSPGVLAESEGSPGKLVCVPAEEKETKPNEPMNQLEKQLKAEHGRHGKEVGKAIDEFKSIDEFEKAIDGEQADHLEKCMKAIDDSYETMGREPNKPEKAHKKSIDEFKSDMQAEHLEHIKCFGKAIEEFKGTPDAADGDPAREKAIEDFTKSAGAELERHEKAHMDMCKAEAEGMVEGDTEEQKAARLAEESTVAEDETNEKAVLNAAIKLFDVHMVEIGNTGIKGYSIPSLEEFEKLMKLALKAGRAISAANKEKLKAIITALEEHHSEHGKSVDDVTAALKALLSSGDGGEETSPKPEGDGKALNSRSSTSGAADELEIFLFTQRLVRQVKTASEGALRQINEKIKELRSHGR